jgi:trehalose 6-phosphate synthase/phosphatase
MSDQRDRARRLLVVSNRLPFTAVEKDGDLAFEPSAGGLVSGLTGYLESAGGHEPGGRRNYGQSGETPSARIEEYLWVGWPGTSVDLGKQEDLTRKARDLNAYPVFISEGEMDRFYYGFCNSTVWPLFHYFPSFAYYEEEYWQEYVRVNEVFADAVARVARPDDIIWVHDYQLMLLPGMLRKRMPGASIGFFLHIPFPGYELFRLMPRRWGTAILEGMLGADLVGFHTHDYAQYFMRSVLRVLGLEHNMGQMVVGDRIARIETFPMGIDFERYHDSVRLLGVQEHETRLRNSLPDDARVVLSLDRLDYTKGIVHRLHGYETFLSRCPYWHGRVVLMLIVVPSRVGVGRYRETKEQIEELVGRINGQFGTLDWVPIRYQYTSLPFEHLLALYHASDVALVTPLRDGMNLIAKEYIAASTDTGVLILSEMAGAAKELGEAIIINPNSREEIAEALLQALEMPVEEQRARNHTMQQRLRRYDVTTWAGDFMAELLRVCDERDRLTARLLSDRTRHRIAGDYAGAERRLLLLDYDGTLMPFSVDPRQVIPTGRVLDVLSALASDERNDVVVISGRDRNTLERWLGDMPVSLVAEHGAWLRDLGSEWQMSRPLKNDWKPRIRPVLETYADRLPGSFVEEKEFSLVWHYRAADPELGATRAQELLDHLVNFTANIDVQVLQGNKVIEVKTGGVNKGMAGAHHLAATNPDFVLAVGDDWTDEYLFMALPESAYTLRVGLSHSQARYNVLDHLAVLDLLTELSRIETRDGAPVG